MLKNLLKSSIYLIALTIVSAVGAVLINSALAVWTGPTASPPSGNVENLLNTSATAQTKSGDLAVNKLTAGVGGLCISTDCKTAWSQVTGAASGWTKSGANVYLSTLADYVGIGIATPNKQLHIKTATGNAEMDIQSASQNYWALYQDATSGELRYWNNSVTSTSTKNALVITSTGYLKLPTPIAANDAATKGYVDAASGGGKSKSQKFTASGTFTVPSGVTLVWVSMVGGGGGGGRWCPDNCGGGGGGGGTVWKYPITVTSGSSIAVTIGAGGAGGSSWCNSGGNGSATFFGSLYAPEGKGGVSSSAPSQNKGGAGGGYTSHAWFIAGGAGGSLCGYGASVGMYAGRSIGGGASAFGDGAYSNTSAGANTGAGGGGASTEPSLGGNGGSGLAIVEWVE